MPSTVQSEDTPVIALSQRFPLLLKDISQWVAINPESARYSPPGKPASIPCRSMDLLINWTDAAGVIEHMKSRKVIHVFHNIAAFLAFLPNPGSIDCLSHPNWFPLLLIPLGGNSHARKWLENRHPRDWPWPLMEEKHMADPASRALGQDMANTVNQWSTELYGRLVKHYADRPTPAAILAGGQRPLRILAYASAGSAYQAYCARDLADAFKGAGHEAMAFVPDNTAAVNFELMETISQFDPDVLLLNGKNRKDCVGLPDNLCVLSWDQDYVLSNKASQPGAMGVRDLLMVMIQDWQQDALDAGVASTRIAHVNLGVNHRLYRPATTRQELEYDILFVGNIHPFEKYKNLIAFDKLDTIVQQMMTHGRQRLAEWVLSRQDGQAMVIPEVATFLRTCLNELGHDHRGDAQYWRSLVHYFRYRIAHMLLRELYVSALGEFRLGLFGRGWDAFPAVAAHARPEVENGQPLVDLIHRSAISIHLHTWTVHHPRLYDTAAAGGFLLVGRVPEANPLDTSFTPGDELDTFGSIPELKRKIRYYLDHPDQRQQMAERAAQRAQRDHTMERRAADMIRFLQAQPHA